MVLDLHIQGIIAKGWQERLSSATRFAQIFAAYEFDPDEVEMWREALAPGGDTAACLFGTAFNSDKPNNPQVALLLTSSPAKVTPFGHHAGRLDDGSEIRSIMVDDTVAIYIYNGHPQLLRVMFEVILSVMIDSAVRLLKAYETFSFAGGGDLEAERNLMPQELGMLVRVLRYNATRVAVGSSAAPQAANKPVFVARDDVTEDGYTGGVSAVPEPVEDEEE